MKRLIRFGQYLLTLLLFLVGVFLATLTWVSWGDLPVVGTVIFIIPTVIVNALWIYLAIKWGLEVYLHW